MASSIGTTGGPKVPILPCTLAAQCRGTVIGILKAFLGLSASAYVTLYVSFLDPNATAFVLLLAIAPAVLCLLCSPFINYVRIILLPVPEEAAYHLVHAIWLIKHSIITG